MKALEHDWLQWLQPGKIKIWNMGTNEDLNNFLKEFKVNIAIIMETKKKPKGEKDLLGYVMIYSLSLIHI